MAFVRFSPFFLLLFIYVFFLSIVKREMEGARGEGEDLWGLSLFTCCILEFVNMCVGFLFPAVQNPALRTGPKN